MTVALALMSAEKVQRHRPPRRLARSGAVAAQDDAARRDLGRDDPVTDPSTSSTIRQWTSSHSGGVPARASSLPSEVTKQVACAAASSSSGLVFPSGSPTREAIVVGGANDPELTPVTTPAPRAVVPSR